MREGTCAFSAHLWSKKVLRALGGRPVNLVTEIWLPIARTYEGHGRPTAVTGAHWMLDFGAVVTGDDLLQIYLHSTDEESEHVLAKLCSDVLLPRCRMVVRARLWGHRLDIEDVTHDVVMRLVRRLRQLRLTPDSLPVRAVAEWATGAALKACTAFLRKEHPLRTHLANALRYRLGRSVVFRLWKGPNGRLMCGWRKCSAMTPLTEAAFQQILTLPRVAKRLASVEPEYSPTLWRALAVLFASAPGPIYFHALISELISRSTADSSRGPSVVDLPEPPGDADAADLAVQRELLATLWRTVMKLPRDERLALLLNLRGFEGIAAWWEHDVVTVAEVAVAAELPPNRLADLPLSDFEIADLLGLAEPDQNRRRQRVINLRRSARRRLNSFFDVD